MQRAHEIAIETFHGALVFVKAGFCRRAFTEYILGMQDAGRASAHAGSVNQKTRPIGFSEVYAARMEAEKALIARCLKRG